MLTWSTGLGPCLSCSSSAHSLRCVPFRRALFGSKPQSSGGGVRPHHPEGRVSTYSIECSSTLQVCISSTLFIGVNMESRLFVLYFRLKYHYLIFAIIFASLGLWKLFRWSLCWAACPLNVGVGSGCLGHFLSFWHRRHLRLILSVLFPTPTISWSSEHRWLLLLENETHNWP